MKNDNLFDDLEDKEIDELMKYAVPFPADNGINIKNKFLQKANMRHKKLPLKKIFVWGALASTLLVSTLAYAQVLDFSKIYKIVFGDNSKYVEQYIQPFVSEHTVTPNEKETQTVIESEYDGIVFKLISVINDGDVLRIFATMQDTTGNKLSDKIDFSSWGLSQGHGGNATVVDYNSETKTTTILITSLGGGHEGFATLSINGLKTNRENKSGLKENKINVYELLQDYIPNTMMQEEVYKLGGAHLVYKNGTMVAESPLLFRLLKFDEKEITFDNIDWSLISNIGFVDGHLHIQTRALSDNENQLASIDFVDSNNKVIHSGHFYLSYVDFENSHHKPDAPPHNLYTEMVYEEITDLKQLKDLRMAIDIVEVGKAMKGNWEFSFEIPKKVTTEFNIGHDMNINDEMIKVDAVLLSPLGITLNLPENISQNYKHKDSASVKYDDGTIIELKKVKIDGYENMSTLNFSGNIIEIEKVHRIVINNEVIVIK